MSDFIQVITTTDSAGEAHDIAQHLLMQRLAGCVQVSGPIASSYWWEGQLESSEEWSCAIKTTASRYAEVEREIRAKHSYDEPEVIALPIVAGSESYLAWLASVVEAG